ncbi:MAG: Fe-S-cluster containining protein [Kiritimatiellia bacterium]|jgi:Fe-S-cluster containining protein
MTMSTPTRTLDDARWDCKACGACCRDFALGPIKPSIIQGLHDLNIERDHEPAKDGFAAKRPGPDGSDAWYFKRRDDGACIFLLPDNLCSIHALHGPEAKPAFCREYPFSVVQDDTGTVVTVRQDCCGAWRTFEDGTPLPEHTESVLALDRAYAIGQFNMTSVPVLPNVAVQRDDWQYLEQRLLDDVKPARPEQVNAQVRELLFSALRRRPPATDPYRADAATQHLVTAIHRALGAAVQTSPGASPETKGMQAFLSSVHAVLDTALPALPGDDDVHERSERYLDLVWRSQLISKSFQSLGSVPAWLGLYLLGTRIARAHAHASDLPTPADLGPPLSTWIRFTRHRAAQRMLSDLQPALIDLFLYAA